MAKCVNCSKLLEPVWGPNGVVTKYQFNDALWVGFFGGYGMFVDNMVPDAPPILGNADYEAVLCHECAHELCDKVPWVKKLLEPETAHPHTV